MNDSISEKFLGEPASPQWWEDARLNLLEHEFNLIEDQLIKQFVKYMLSYSSSFWEAPFSLDLDAGYKEDELEPHGLFLHTQRTVRTFLLVAPLLEMERKELDCMFAALLLRNVTKMLKNSDDEWQEVPYYTYHIDRYIEQMIANSEINSEDIGHFVTISPDDINTICRLVRSSVGLESLVPETLPLTMSEKMMCIIEMIASYEGILFHE